jgi:hypothetical protein
MPEVTHAMNLWVWKDGYHRAVGRDRQDKPTVSLCGKGTKVSPSYKSVKCKKCLDIWVQHLDAEWFDAKK